MSATLATAVAEIEQHVAAGGWDRPPMLYALVSAAALRAEDPGLADRLGLADVAGGVLTPIEQEELPAGELDEVLAQLAWPDAVEGCALAQEIVLLPPSAEAGLSDAEVAARAAGHPDRREARLVVGVLADGTTAAVLRLRGDGEDDLLTGPDLAPNLARALLDTFAD
ncbi:MAG: PPA1309 family protein [Jatrophihabitans sp.]|uniref:PPA1309 family protein n=1 Tax=Jatrophihabitans sp. TaxID=1932789 RepID=UPI003F7F8ECA